ncbi:MAG: sugar phosphate isomerase/epimerase family protein [Verrucomicrobiia bacterium]|jgi:sugar phosphate isomerase/epimerase
MSTKSLSRRNFLKHTSTTTLGLAALGAASAHAMDPIQRIGKPRLDLSLAAYSFRNYFEYQPRGKKKEGIAVDKKMDMFKFIDYCADQGLAGTELTSYFFPDNAGADYFSRINAHAKKRGIAISGTAVGNNFARPKGPELDKEIADVKRWIDKAAIMGAPHIRIFAGRATGTDDAEARKMCIASIEECCDYAGKWGVKLGIENHGGIVAEAAGMLEIIEAVKSPHFGVNLDTGNFHTDWPYRDLARIAPYAINVQLKVEMSGRGLPHEPANLERLTRILEYSNYQGFVVLEYEAKPDPYTAVPPLLKELKGLFA